VTAPDLRLVEWVKAALWRSSIYGSVSALERFSSVTPHEFIDRVRVDAARMREAICR
jgi:hypothetical protein